MSAAVLALFIAPRDGASMASKTGVHAIAGIGLEGDRYAAGTGAFSNAKRQAIRQVSLISVEGIAASNALLGQPFGWNETRRNIITRGVDLNALVGREFLIASVRFRGAELCTPCARPTKLAGKPDFKDAFDGRGGLRAEILTSGLVFVGDVITVL